MLEQAFGSASAKFGSRTSVLGGTCVFLCAGSRKHNRGEHCTCGDQTRPCAHSEIDSSGTLIRCLHTSAARKLRLPTEKETIDLSDYLHRHIAKLEKYKLAHLGVFAALVLCWEDELNSADAGFTEAQREAACDMVVRQSWSMDPNTGVAFCPEHRDRIRVCFECRDFFVDYTCTQARCSECAENACLLKTPSPDECAGTAAVANAQSTDTSASPKRKRRTSDAERNWDTKRDKR